MNGNTKELIRKLESNLSIIIDVQRERRLWTRVEPEKLLDIISYVKNEGFDHLSTISATDWLEEGKFEITYHFWSYSIKVVLTIKTKIDRKNPVIESINNFYGTNAESCERELHEMFGIVFIGNSDLTELFLEDWNELPPFRKDFDWHKYVQEEFYDKENSREKVYFEGKQ